MSLPPPAEREELAPLLDDLSRAVEDLALSGLAAASDTTRQTLAVSFKAASGRRLLRLGSTLRVAVEEIGRFANDDPLFSRRRFSFFLHRAWMLSRGMRHALAAEDEAQWDALTWQPGGRALERVEVVTLGVAKRVVPNAFAAFDFRMRALGGEGVEPGTPLLWSCVFPLRPGAEVPADAYLHLPQKQGFVAADLIPGYAVEIANARLAEDGRLALTDDSKVERGKRFADWERFLGWSVEPALERLRAHVPGPFDLEIELAEEIVLGEWEVGAAEPSEREASEIFPVFSDQGEFHAPVSTDASADTLRKALVSRAGKRVDTPLFAVMHYEMCRLIVQPLTLFTSRGPEPLMLSKESFDAKALIGTLKFT